MDTVKDDKGKSMAFYRWGLLAFMLLSTAPVFAGSCNLATVTLINQTQESLTWNAGIDVGTVGTITSEQAATQPIAPGQKILITLHDDKKGIKGYFNFYDDDDGLIATLNIDYSNQNKTCKLSKSYKNITKGYKISYPDEDSKDQAKANNNITFYIKHS